MPDPAKHVDWTIPADSEPLRTELLSTERLADTARALASTQCWTVDTQSRTVPLLSVLDRAEVTIEKIYTLLATDARNQAPISVSAEWLLDNYYLVEEQIRTVRDDLPADYGLELPRLCEGSLRGYPRIFEAMLLLVSASDARLDRERLIRFVMAFQDSSPLTIGEVWAIPIMLRIALVDNVRRLSARISASHTAIKEADAWADRVLEALQSASAHVEQVMHELERARPTPSPAFLIRFSQRLQDHEDADAAVLWADHKMAERGVSYEALAFEEHQEQAADQVSIANTITSIRFLGALEWREFFETCSLVEQILREDPAGVYSRMDFVSRDRYRHAVEMLARRSPRTEIEIAEAAVSLALESLSADASDPSAAHVGFYLISTGRLAFEQCVGYRPRLRERLYRGPLASKGLVYWGLFALITIVLAALLTSYVVCYNASLAWTVALVVFSLAPLAGLALDVVNRLATHLWPARVLPKLDFHEPVAAAHRTMVVIPALLTSPQATQHIIDNLEIAYLSNRDPNILFGLIGDLPAHAAEVAPGDAAVIDAARHGISALNEAYRENGIAPFSLFIRGRSFNGADEVWMGWERKRGALEEFNRLLRGSNDTSFSVCDTDRRALASVTFVITLDADTVLPHDGARKLISTIAHPLNRAQIDVDRRRVLRGYGLVQPRVSMSLESAERSPFAWMHSGQIGIDPYAGAVSDAYQDVFGEGSFTGKGIYEVDVYNAVLQGRLPENTLLSHDLLEGSYLRTALASDIEVLDDQPSSYVSHTARSHRWVRGDWQTLPWLGRMVPTRTGRERNPLTMLHRWKILDNLRRSLSAPSLLLLAVCGWVALPGYDWAWLAIVLAIELFPVYFGAFDALVFRSRDRATRRDFRSIARDYWRDIAQLLVALVVLPHQAYMMLDAIARALYRMFVTHRNMLEWETAADVERRLGPRLADFGRRMWTGEAITFSAAVIVAMLDLPSLVSATPLLLAWAIAPYIAWRVSLPTPEPVIEISDAERASVRRIARRTWRFFETFVTPEDHYLAPDNFQEDPEPVVAHRTSPTNMGLQLISGLTAYDLGFIGLSRFVDLTSRTLSTMVGLERYRGHFYNWYDTTTLQPLRPSYVSTVDSGNLAGHLVALRAGLMEVSESPLIGSSALTGIAETVRLALEELLAFRDDLGPAEAVVELRTSLEELLRRIRLDQTPADLGEWWSVLSALASLADTVTARLAALRPRTSGDEAALASVTRAVDAVRVDVHYHLDDLERYTPWAPLLGQVPRAALTDESLSPLVSHTPSLVGLAEGFDVTLAHLDELASAGDDTSVWAARVAAGIREARPQCVQLLAELRLAADMAQEIWEHTDFSMLFDRNRMLFSIGFNTAEGKLEESFYDMLASECRLASYVAIAKGDVPQEHWFRLGRAITETEAGRALVSWSASMFEYLMPLLVMKSWPGTLLDQTYRTIVRRQIQYGQQRGVPWGVSESAFAARDAGMIYQYQAFGIPGLGLKRGLSEDVVVAPYATVLALPLEPHAALQNLDTLARQGAEGQYGFYEAVDYTPGRVPAGKRRAIVRCYMAHHQGMSMVSLGNVLTGRRMQERFHRDPVMHSAELLLQERVPRRVHIAQPHVEEVEFVRSVREPPPAVTRSYPTPHTPVPATHFLSNGSYSVMVTNGGGGYSRWRGRTVTRYREDITRDCWGTFFYLKDLDTGRVWSATYQPVLAEPDDYHVTFSADKAEYRRLDGDVETHTEVVVSPEDDVEIRRITVTNRGREALRIELTSYAEVTLAERGADHAHKAFSNLFVETSAESDLGALIFSRRPRSSTEQRVWGMHVVACDHDVACECSYETDRAAFLGRLGTPVAPRAIVGSDPLTKSVGAVLDPIVALRQTLTIEPGGTAHLAFSTGVAESREAVLALAEKYHDITSAQRALDLAWSTSQIELRDLGITPQEAVTYQRLASRLLLTDPYSRLKVFTEKENRLPISALWSIGISGDLPILLVEIERVEETPLVKQALLAHQYWRSRGFECDLVLLNTKPSAYASELDGRLRMLLRTGHALQLLDRHGGVYLRTADQVPTEVCELLRSVARAVLTGDGGPIALQLNQRADRPGPPDPFIPGEDSVLDRSPAFERPPLAYDNGVGGFDIARDEYVVVLDTGMTTPAPWVNVVANPSFGGLISEAGVGCTWALNSHENRITTWNNDPVSDGTGEAIYIRDENTGQFWSPTPLPVRSAEPYVIRHGRGYTRFEHTSHGISHTLDWFVAASDPVRIARLRVENLTERTRALSVTHFVEWSLGDSRSKAQQRVVTWFDEDAQALMAHSWFNADFPGRPAFLASDGEVASYTANRMEFIGRNGDPRDPAAMRNRTLGRETGRFLDNCGAIQRTLTLAPHESAEIVFLLGQTETVESAHALIARYRQSGAAEQALVAVRSAWRRLLGTVQVRTPDKELDLMVNGAALYQTLACRFWGRTATYQSSGAYGFRDQLQDCLALLYARPDLVREHIIEASRHQFLEGDVLHWWHPYSGRGVRTRFVDDRLWLPYVTAEYIAATGDESVLDVEVPYLEGPAIPDDREDLYLQPQPALRVGTIYEHCCAAIEASRGTGAHGLPLMGGGDWNDGMNRVGIGGSGESVWMAWFLDVVLRAFAPLAERRGEPEVAQAYRERAASLIAAVEREAWDGAWYRRAFFDDGTPLGTRTADECRIDAIAQAWAHISGSGDRARALRAIEAVEEKLVRWEDGLIALLTPPFDHMDHDPGYIKGYVPGVRENGGQYTHAAIWVVLAYTLMGDGDEALALFDLLNPVNHALDPTSLGVYKVEPYVIAADVYAVPPHVGRGGWTWYTGSASWMYRVAVREICGLRLEADGEMRYLRVDPCVPKSWSSWTMQFTYENTTYAIEVTNPRGVNRGVESVTLDGSVLDGLRVPLEEDGGTHHVSVTMLGGDAPSSI